MKLIRIMRTVYCDPWLITPQMHLQISQIVTAHANGDAHANGMTDMFEQEKCEMEIVDDIAIIPIQGVMGNKVSKIEKSSGVCDMQDVADMIDMAVKSESVKGIVLDIDSPGGTVSGTPDLGLVITEARGVKPVISYTSGPMCSAAYWVGSQAHAIVSGPSATVGSIGVYLPILDSSRALEMQGLKVELFKAGKYKGAGVQGVPLTDEQREMFQSRVDQIHSNFKAAVRSGRGKGLSDDDMEGQDFLALEAVGKGLIDTIGTRAVAIQTAKDLARIGIRK